VINTVKKSTAVPAFPAASVKGGGRAGVPSGQIQVGSTSTGLPGYPVFNLGNAPSSYPSSGIELVDRASPYVAASMPVAPSVEPVKPAARVSAWSRMAKADTVVEEYTGPVSGGAHTEGPLEPAYQEPMASVIEPLTVPAAVPAIGGVEGPPTFDQWALDQNQKSYDQIQADVVKGTGEVDAIWQRGVLAGVRDAWDGGEVEGIDVAGEYASNYLGTIGESDLNESEMEWLDSLQNQINMGFKP
jgi:hypothetical protein